MEAIARSPMWSMQDIHANLTCQVRFDRIDKLYWESTMSQLHHARFTYSITSSDFLLLETIFSISLCCSFWDCVTHKRTATRRLMRALTFCETARSFLSSSITYICNHCMREPREDIGDTYLTLLVYRLLRYGQLLNASQFMRNCATEKGSQLTFLTSSSSSFMRL